MAAQKGRHPVRADQVTGPNHHHGPRAGARQSLGTTGVFGMLAATMIGIFVIPVFYVVIQRISERRSPFARDPEAGK